jgi:hypothetical protein
MGGFFTGVKFHRRDTETAEIKTLRARGRDLIEDRCGGRGYRMNPADFRRALSGRQ